MKYGINCKLRFSSTSVEAAYRKGKEIYVITFIKVLISIALGSVIVTLFKKDWFEAIPGLSVISGLLITCCLLRNRLQNYKDLQNMALALLSLGFLVNETFSLRGLIGRLEVSSAVHVGYVLGTFERIILQHICRLETKFVFLVACTTVRLLVIPVDNNIVLVYHWVWWFINILNEIWMEYDCRIFFKKFYDSKEELIKFKDLMVSSMPINVLILSRDLEKKLFCNDHFQSTFNIPKSQAGPDWNINEWLSGFFIEKESLNGSSKDALGDDVNKSLNMSQVFQKLIEKRLLDDHSHQFCFNIRNQDNDDSNKRKIFETQIFSLPWDGKSAVAVILNDVTQQFMNLALRVAASNKDKMIAMVSHELRTPLNCILGMIAIMEKQIVDSEILNYLTVCKNNAKLLLSLVNSILDLGQIRNNKFKLTVSKGNIQEILQEIYLLFEIQFKAKELYLKIDITSDVNQTIVSDLNRLRQILINLIGNALKFTSEGGVVILVSNNYLREGYLNFKVSDTGIGIKSEDKKKLFKMYGRLDNSDAGLNSEGVGLGLTISNHLVRLLADNEEDDGIQVESEFGQGSAFSFSIKADLSKHTQAEYDVSQTEGREHSRILNDSQEFVNKLSNYMLNTTNFFLSSPFHGKDKLVHPPLLRGPSYSTKRSANVSHSFKTASNFSSHDKFTSPSTSFSNAVESTKFLMKTSKKGKVLLVDDSPFNLMVAKHLLEGLGYHVESALNGEVAINIIKVFASKGKHFNIILMDCQMPIMDGFETTRILRKMMQSGEIEDAPIVALSANDADRDKEMCREAGMVDHLSKPLNEEKLQETMRRFCKQKR